MLPVEAGHKQDLQASVVMINDSKHDRQRSRKVRQRNQKQNIQWLLVTITQRHNEICKMATKSKACYHSVTVIQKNKNWYTGNNSKSAWLLHTEMAELPQLLDEAQLAIQ
jgi:3-dehydroquinate synthase class II